MQDGLTESRKWWKTRREIHKYFILSYFPVSFYLFPLQNIQSILRNFFFLFFSLFISFYFFAAVVVVWNQQQPNSNWSIQMQIQVGVKFFLMYK